MSDFKLRDKVKLDNSRKDTGTIIGWGTYQRHWQDPMQVAALVQLDNSRYLHESDDRPSVFISVLCIDKSNLELIENVEN